MISINTGENKDQVTWLEVWKTEVGTKNEKNRDLFSIWFSNIINLKNAQKNFSTMASKNNKSQKT